MTTAIIASSTPVDITTYEQNVTACLKSTNQFGQTLYQNICTGAQYTVPHGFWDMTGSLILAAIGIGIVLVLMGLMLRVILDF